VSESSSGLELQGYGPVEISIVPSKTRGHIFLRLLGSGRPVSMHLSASEIRELIEKMHEGLEESMLEEAGAGDAESSLYLPRHKPL